MIKNKKFSITLTLLLVLITLATSLLFLVPKRENTLHADEGSSADYTFNGATLWQPFTTFNSSHQPLTSSYDGGYYIDYGNFNFTISKPSDTTVSLTFSGGGNFANGHGGGLGTYLESYTRYNVVNFNMDISSNNTFYVPFDIYGNFHGTYYNGTSPFYLACYISSNNFSSFIPNIYKVYQYYDWDSTSYLGGNHVRYYDVNDNWLDISISHYFKPIGVYSGYTDDPFGQSPRTYFLTNILNDNESFQSGYDQGYQDGLGDGNSEGYENGYNAGNTIGYNNGYSAGVEASNQYTFLSLMGSVLDAPLKTFTSLLNFNLLGVNILSFITGLLTLAIIVFVVKLILGGK